MLSSEQKLKKIVKVRVPGTCGEWIQTVSANKECLISLPINRFTTLEVSYKAPHLALESQSVLMPKSLEAFKKITTFLKLQEGLKDQIYMAFQERLEIGKGMASSTADITAIMTGVSALVEMPVSDEMLLKLACEIEPSDGIMFGGLALVDHLGGQLLEKFDFDNKIKILMLKPVETYNTQSMRMAPDYAEKLKMKTEEPLRLFKVGLAEQTFDNIGRASTLSLLENESVLEKPYLGDLIKIAEKNGCYGLVGGHSGTVCGFLLNEEKTDLEKLIHALEDENLGTYYASYEVVETFNKGIDTVVRVKGEF